jgi:hypothetical protein
MRALSRLSEESGRAGRSSSMPGSKRLRSRFSDLPIPLLHADVQSQNAASPFDPRGTSAHKRPGARRLRLHGM